MDIKKSIDKFLNEHRKSAGRKPNERYASFDYCYNYFYTFYRNKNLSELADRDNLQMSCLQVGFYLASWGMLRGSSFLLEKSFRNFIPLIEVIAETNPQVWEIDVPNYYDNNIEILLECMQKISNSLGAENKPSDTLVTKIMLGVFANIPAFDQYFRKSFQVNSVNKKSLQKIKDFYLTNQNIFGTYKIYTFDFLSGEDTNVVYTKAKLIDMCGFSDGLNN